MATRIVLWVDTTNKVAPKVMNGGPTIPSTFGPHRPSDPGNLDGWFQIGWRVASASSYGPATHLGLPVEITTLVLEHD